MSVWMQPNESDCNQFQNPSISANLSMYILDKLQQMTKLTGYTFPK